MSGVLTSAISGFSPLTLSGPLTSLLNRPSTVPTEEERKAKFWTNVPFRQGFDGILSAGQHSTKRMIVKHPPNNPHVLAVDIRRWFLSTNRPSKEGIFLMSDEYDYLVFMIGRARTETFTTRNDLGTRSLTIGPYPEIGGVRVVQQTNNKVRSINFTREEIKELLTKYISTKDRAADSFDVFVDKPSGELLDDEVATAKAQAEQERSKPSKRSTALSPPISFDDQSASMNDQSFMRY